MTPDERTCADALRRCTFLPGEYNKRFARNIAAMPNEQELSEKQRANLFRLVHRYRRQIPESVVKLAAQKLKEVDNDNRTAEADD